MAWLPCGRRHACSVSRLDGLIGSQIERQNGALVLLVLNNEGSCFQTPRERVLVTVALRVFMMTFSKTFGYRQPYKQAVNSEH